MNDKQIDLTQGSISEQAQSEMIHKERVSNNAWHKFIRNRSAVVGLCIVAVMVLVGLLAPVIATHDPNAIDMANA